MTTETHFSLKHVSKKIYGMLNNWTPNDTHTSNSDNKSEVEQIELSSVLDRIKSHGFKTITEATNTPVFYCVMQNIEENRPIALVELVPTKKGNEFWLKMLNVYLSPKEFSTKNNGDKETLRKQLSQIFASIVSGIIQIGSELPQMTTVKLYGRSEALLDFFESMTLTLNEMVEITTTFPGISITIEGRWLVLRISKEQIQLK